MIIDEKKSKRFAFLISFLFHLILLSCSLPTTELIITKEKEMFMKIVKTAWKSLKKLGLTKDASLNNLSVTCDLKKSLEGSHFVQESAPEKLDLKQDLYYEMGEILPKNIIISSSTSGFMMSDIQKKCNSPERTIIGHPFNPVYLLPAVEIVPGKKTSKKFLNQAKKFYQSISMNPIMVKKELPGYLSDRLQEALWREGLHIINEGYATTEDLDRAIEDGPGLRWSLMGTFLTFHLAGGKAGMKHMLEQFGPALKLPWTKLKAPKLSKKLSERLISGTKKQAKGKSINQLSNIRDEYLVELQNLRKKYENKIRK